MYTFSIPPQSNYNRRQAKIDLYSDQTDELLATSQQLRLAHDLVSDYSQVDAAYYLQMYIWLNTRYDYIIDYSFSFIPYPYATY
jgi:hypothetical protein